MMIQWLGMSCFKIQTGETTIILDPHKGKGKIKTPRIVNGDIVVHSSGETVGNGPKDAFVVKGPGEYEIGGVFVQGRDVGGNRMFLLEAERIRVGFMGNLSEVPENGELELVEHSDILIVPVGGKTVLAGKAAAKLATTIDPRVIIPMSYSTKGHPAPFDSNAEFLKELGKTENGEETKYKITYKNLPQDKTEVVVLTPQ